MSQNSEQEGDPAPGNVYRGRFAPSPSGPLHHGSLLIALASYLDAKANDGQWLVRIEDVDELRTVKGAESEIFRALEAHGLFWDERCPNQSTREARYLEALDQLTKDHWLYICDCPRKKLRALGGPYPGTCRERVLADSHAAAELVGQAAIRFNTSLTHHSFAFDDQVQGKTELQLSTLGDFIVKRRDGLFAYQLAVVIDDHDQGISHILRGTDLLDSTPWQMALQDALGFGACQYAHLPILKQNGSKLSKQTGATAVTTDNLGCRRNLLWALEILGQELPCPSKTITSVQTQLPSCEDILAFAVANWDLQKVPRKVSLPLVGLLP